MNFYFNKKNVEQYKAMMEEYDNSFVLQRLKNVLPKGLSLLELGSGTGADLLELSKHYRVAGSDLSPVFIEDFHFRYPEIEMLKLDAADFSLEKTYDCIYSNKVLYHLSAAELKKSLQIQAAHLRDNGIVFMTMWYGPRREEMYEDELRFMYYTEEDLVKEVPENLRVEKLERYTEAEEGDSIIAVLRKIR